VSNDIRGWSRFVESKGMEWKWLWSISRNDPKSPAETEQNNKDPESQQQLPWLQLVQGTSRIQDRSII